MAEAEEPQFSTLAERIAALNKQKNFNSPSSPPAAQSVQGRKPPPPPPATVSRRTSADDGTVAHYVPPPVRRQPGPPPSLPPRRPSGQHLQSPSAVSVGRRPSSESVLSNGSTASISTRTLSRVSSNTSQSSGGGGLRKMAPAFGTTELPPLPPTKREREAAQKEAAKTASIQRAARRETEQEEIRSRTPALPSRPAATPKLPPRSQTVAGPPPPLPSRRPTNNTAESPAPTLPKRHTATKSALERGFGPSKPALPRRPSATPGAGGNDDDNAPPPPIASRPSQAQIHAAFRGVTSGSSARQQASLSGAHSKRADDVECMICRDFSAPDEVASRYPVSVLPRQDTVAYLARQLCGGFTSPTDKARAIFTWCHHNIAYDVDGFFGGCIPRGQSVSESIFSGKAVCEGYAKIYEGVARAAGLECVVVTGHGKGFGFDLVLPGQPVPRPDPTGHAWNAVRIDGGEWKLLDACWGAGNVSDKRAERYEKAFDPTMFTMSNEEFGERHFPSNPAYFFRADGGVLSWAEYVVEKSAEPPVTLCSNLSDQFIGPHSVEPSRLSIPVRGSDEMVHFRFGRSCRHWDFQKHGKGLQPYLMQIKVLGGGADGRSDEMFEVHYDAPMRWWADVPRRKLGRPGDTITCFAFTQLNDRDMRGATLADFEAPMRQKKIAMVGICMWKLV